MKVVVSFIMEDANTNGQPDVHVELSVGTLTMKSPILDGPSLAEVLGMATKLLGLKGLPKL